MAKLMMRSALMVLALLALCSFAAPSDVDQNQANNPYKAPIFRDRDEDNTVTSTQASASEPATEVVQPEVADVAAYLGMDETAKTWLNSCYKRQNPSVKDKAYCDQLYAWAKLIDLLQRNGNDAESMALKLGSGAGSGATVSSDLTNYAPDNFSVSEIMELFEVNEKLRKSGLSLSEGMKKVNKRMLRTYIQALSGAKPVDGCESLDEEGECTICEIGLVNKKPCVAYPCGHVYHQKCALVSTAKQDDKSIKMCPQCSSYYRIPLVPPKTKA